MPPWRTTFAIAKLIPVHNPSPWEFGYTRVLPTVLRFGGLRVVIYPNDHRPAHVHAIGRGGEAVFNLNCPAGPVELRENYGFSRREIVRTV
jgi:hypothetical protein